MTTLSPPVSDLDLGIDIGVRMGLDALTAEVDRQQTLAANAAEHGFGAESAARSRYTAAVLQELAGELAGRFR
jgi:hypothetical protein